MTKLAKYLIFFFQFRISLKRLNLRKYIRKITRSLKHRWRQCLWFLGDCFSFFSIVFFLQKAVIRRHLCVTCPIQCSYIRLRFNSKNRAYTQNHVKIAYEVHSKSGIKSEQCQSLRRSTIGRTNNMVYLFLENYQIKCLMSIVISSQNCVFRIFGIVKYQCIHPIRASSAIRHLRLVYYEA